MEKVVVGVLALAACLWAQSTPQDEATAQAQKTALKNAQTAGLPLPAAINVADNVNIEAVLLPFQVANHVFGKDVADNYAVIEVNISNRSNDAALIVQSMFIDLQNWGFAGPMSSGLTAGGVIRNKPSSTFQSRGNPLEVSSVEYRVVRGEMLDRQPWTKRNFSLRTLQALGSIGVAFAFPFTKDVATGIAAWNGAVIPAFQSLFPDSMQAQLDRVSDYGFRNNKVIPQQAADIVVAFFPIKRFLTPALEQVFLTSPALFFNPILIALDPSGRSLVDPILKSVYSSKNEADTAFKALIQQYSNVSALQMQYDLDLTNVANAETGTASKTPAAPDGANKPAQNPPAPTDPILDHWQKQRDADKEMLDVATHALAGNSLYGLLGSLSLNNVHVVVSGTMTVDVDSVPAIITSIECSKGTDKSSTIWAQAGELNCVMHGSFLSNATPLIAEASALGLTVGTVTTGSTDALLNFKLTLSKPLDPKTVLTFTVTKKNKQGNTVESMKFPFPVADYTLPSISKVAINGSTVTVTGADFYDTAKSPLSVTAHAVAPAGVKDQPVSKPSSETLTQIEFDAKSFPSGCYQVQIKSGSASATASTDKPPKDEFSWLLNPKIDFKTLSGSTLTITLDQLFNLPDCGMTLTFQVLSDAANATAQVVTNQQFSSDGKTVTLTLPALPSGAKNWKSVEALSNGSPLTPPVIASINK